jgi:anti-sigma regulatory factor (Ser/Thr protein kinase)
VSRCVEVDPASDAPSYARHFARAQLTELLTGVAGVAETIGDVELLVSELVSNAVKASAGPVTLGVQVHHTWLDITVHDDNPYEPVVLDPDPGDIHGRGLQIVTVLAEDWGVQSQPADGKTVWVRLPLPAGATADLTCERPGDREWATRP